MGHNQNAYVKFLKLCRKPLQGPGKMAEIAEKEGKVG
jgi:hypothetical protein